MKPGAGGGAVLLPVASPGWAMGSPGGGGGPLFHPRCQRQPTAAGTAQGWPQGRRRAPSPRHSRKGWDGGGTSGTPPPPRTPTSPPPAPRAPRDPAEPEDPVSPPRCRRWPPSPFPCPTILERGTRCRVIHSRLYPPSRLRPLPPLMANSDFSSPGNPEIRGVTASAPGGGQEGGRPTRPGQRVPQRGMRRHL